MQVVALIFSFLMLIPPYHLSGKSVVFFSPDDRPTQHLLSYIEKAKHRIYAAVYMFTDKKLANALIDAKEKRNVDVQIVVDQTSVHSPYGKINLLKQHNIDTHIFYTPQFGSGRMHPLMHHKFAVIDEKVWTGSFNWTISANSRNQENVLWTDEKEVCEKFLAQFERLKERCQTNLKKRESTLRTTVSTHVIKRKRKRR